MSVSGLVNIITPAYNSSSFITRLLDSVLSQTYPMIKMIVIDDGSTDNTREIIEQYVSLFSDRGFDLLYVYQKNAGQSFAINNALKLVDGEFLLWPDSDDWYKSSSAIEIMVNTLKCFGDEVGVARCRYEFVEGETYQSKWSNFYPNYGVSECISDDAIYQRNGFVWCPGGYIIKTKFLDSFIPNREIYAEKEAGQNFQLLFPYVVKSKCVSIDNVLFCYLVRKDSCSRPTAFEDKKIKLEARIRQYVNTLDRLSAQLSSKLEEYLEYTYWVFYMQLLRNDIEHQDKRSFRHHVKVCKDLNIPLSKQCRRMEFWTRFFGIKSYCMVGKIYSNFKQLVHV